MSIYKIFDGMEKYRVKNIEERYIKLITIYQSVL